MLLTLGLTDAPLSSPYPSCATPEVPVLHFSFSVSFENVDVFNRSSSCLSAEHSPNPIFCAGSRTMPAGPQSPFGHLGPGKSESSDNCVRFLCLF